MPGDFMSRLGERHDVDGKLGSHRRDFNLGGAPVFQKSKRVIYGRTSAKG
jgi:hypothetical protein